MALICRICMKYIDKNMHVYSTDDKLTHWSVKTMIEACIPQLRVFVVQTPVICHNCVILICAAYQLRKDSENTETRITNYVLQTGVNPTHVDLNHVLAFEDAAAQRGQKRCSEDTIPIPCKMSKRINEESILKKWPTIDDVVDFTVGEVTINREDFLVNSECTTENEIDILDCETPERSSSPENEVLLFHNYAKKPCFEGSPQKDALTTDEILLMPSPSPPFSCIHCTFRCNSSSLLLEHIRTHSKCNKEQSCREASQMGKTKMKRQSVTDGFLGFSQSEILASQLESNKLNSWPYLAWLTPQVIVEKLDG